MNIPSPWHRYLEIVYLVVVIAAGYHCVAERIDYTGLPYGDEGSWMAAGAELSKGNGFTTRWLEHGFLKPYALPRPDDYRYPGLVCLLAGAFMVFGTTYTTALWLVGTLFLLFGLAVYGVVRRRFGIRTAACTIPLVYFSLLQLLYNTKVYTESLFGIVVAFILLISCIRRPSQTSWWTLTGLGIGLLYCVRPNGIIFAAAFVLYGSYAIWAKKADWRKVVLGVAIIGAVMLPWLIRTWVAFGTPFHLAGSAGLLRAQPSDPITWSLTDFTRVYGVLYFAKAIVVNIPVFFSILHEQEHGLELVPLLFCIVGVVRRRPFFNGMITTAFILTFFACSYTTVMHSWGGNRYFSPLLPFVYAYGIDQMVRLADRVSGKTTHVPVALAKILTFVILLGILVAPIFFPHRYYERFYADKPPRDKTYTAYYSALKGSMGPNTFYYAGSLAQINFPTGLNCVGMQHLFDEKETVRAKRAFHPALIALTPAEFQMPYFQRLMKALENEGCTLTAESTEDGFAVLVRIGEDSRNVNLRVAN